MLGFANDSGVCSLCLFRVNGRSDLAVLAGIMNPYGLLGYLRFCKLHKSHSKATLLTFFIIFIFLTAVFSLT